MKTRVVFFCLAFVGMMLASGASGETTCSPAPLPPKEERTDDFWKVYLKENLVSCYGNLHPEIGAASIGLHDGWMSTTWCPITCSINIGREFLNSTDTPWDVLFVLGHEATHVVEDTRDFRQLQSQELEFAADFVAIRPIPRGACRGAEILSWSLSRLVSATDFLEVEKQAAILQMEQRILVLQAHCIVDVAYQYAEHIKEAPR